MKGMAAYSATKAGLTGFDAAIAGGAAPAEDPGDRRPAAARGDRAGRPGRSPAPHRGSAGYRSRRGGGPHRAGHHRRRDRPPRGGVHRLTPTRPPTRPRPADGGRGRTMRGSDPSVGLGQPAVLASVVAHPPGGRGGEERGDGDPGGREAGQEDHGGRTRPPRRRMLGRPRRDLDHTRPSQPRAPISSWLAPTRTAAHSATPASSQPTRRDPVGAQRDPGERHGPPPQQRAQQAGPVRAEPVDERRRPCRSRRRFRSDHPTPDPAPQPADDRRRPPAPRRRPGRPPAPDASGPGRADATSTKQPPPSTAANHTSSGDRPERQSERRRDDAEREGRQHDDGELHARLPRVR